MGRETTEVKSDVGVTVISIHSLHGERDNDTLLNGVAKAIFQSTLSMGRET